MVRDKFDEAIEFTTPCDEILMGDDAAFMDDLEAIGKRAGYKDVVETVAGPIEY